MRIENDILILKNMVSLCESRSQLPRQCLSSLSSHTYLTRALDYNVPYLRVSKISTNWIPERKVPQTELSSTHLLQL